MTTRTVSFDRSSSSLSAPYRWPGRSHPQTGSEHWIVKYVCGPSRVTAPPYTRTALANSVTVDNHSRCALTSSRPHFASSPGAASSSSPSCRCCRPNTWCGPGSAADLSISPTPGRLLSVPRQIGNGFEASSVLGPIDHRCGDMLFPNLSGVLHSLVTSPVRSGRRRSPARLIPVKQPSGCQAVEARPRHRPSQFPPRSCRLGPAIPSSL